jgi:excisionase family DNA binding protein
VTSQPPTGGDVCPTRSGFTTNLALLSGTEGDTGLGADQQITLHEVAERLNVHYMTAYRYVRTGRLAAHREGGQYRVSAAEVEKLRRQDRPRRGRARSASRVRLEDRLVAGDEAGAWAVIQAALASGMEPKSVYLDLLGAALRSIGDRWARGQLSVADEHQASTVAARLIGRLGPLFARRGRKPGAVLVGSVAGETHALPSAILADILRGAGFEVIDLGANTPPVSFAEAARRAHRLVAVLIGATVAGLDRQLADTIAAIRAVQADVPILVGGAAVNRSLAVRLAADGWSGSDAQTALTAVETVRARSRTVS